MKSKNTSKILLLILSSTLLFTSCGSGLSRSTAEKIIKEQKGFPIIKYEVLELKSKEQGYGLQDIYTKLQEKGLISISKETGVINQYTGSPETVYTISLTDLGKQYEIKPEQYNEAMKQTEKYHNSFTYFVPYVLLKSYEIDFNSIVSLQKTSDFEQIANFDTKIVNQTPVFDVFNQEAIKMGGGAKTYTDHKVFRKYDDGWK
ncbi:MAG TPA: hypothetical protein PK431_03100 [Chitinophagales bacterium]|jgi:hypothetical protein|nr:hypothetical protein [Chitinophagales bacterium]